MKRRYVHPLPLRVWHWLNVVVVITLLTTGFQLRISGIALLRPHDPALVIHKFAGWAMVGLYAVWFAYSFASRNLSNNYVIRWVDFKGILAQVKFYLFLIFKGETNPFKASPNEKYNPLQKITYSSIMFMLVPMTIVTGFLFTGIDPMRKYMLLWKVTAIVNALHIIAAYVFALFLVIHIYMVTLGSTVLSHIYVMVTGYDSAGEDDQCSTGDEARPADTLSGSGKLSA